MGNLPSVGWVQPMGGFSLCWGLCVPVEAYLHPRAMRNHYQVEARPQQDEMGACRKTWGLQCRERIGFRPPPERLRRLRKDAGDREHGDPAQSQEMIWLGERRDARSQGRDSVAPRVWHLSQVGLAPDGGIRSPGGEPASQQIRWQRNQNELPSDRASGRYNGLRDWTPGLPGRTLSPAAAELTNVMLA